MKEKIEEKTARRNELKNVKWVSHYLGVSRNTIHQWVLEGHVPYINLGVSGGRRIIRFDPDTIDLWLTERTYHPVVKDDPRAKVADELEPENSDHD